MVPAAGSAYTYSYATMGPAHRVHHRLGPRPRVHHRASAVAVGFAGYLNALLDQLFGYTLPESLSAPPATAAR
jgi:APA family basic amino acid/polyamine antiporter